MSVLESFVSITATYLAVHIRNGQRWLCTTLTSLQIHHSYKNPVPIQLQRSTLSQIHPFLTNPTATLTPSLFLKANSNSDLTKRQL